MGESMGRKKVSATVKTGGKGALAAAAAAAAAALAARRKIRKETLASSEDELEQPRGKN
jgi:hypothetical protein